MASVLLVSIQEEATRLREKLKNLETQTEKKEEQKLDSISVCFHVDENSSRPVSVEFIMGLAPLGVSSDMRQSIEDLKIVLQRTEQKGINAAFLERLDELLKKIESGLWSAEASSLQKENERLQELVSTLQEKDKMRALPSEMVTRAQNMCLEAEEETRAAQRKAEMALAQAAKSEERERLANKETNEVNRKLTVALDQIKKLKAEHKVALETADEDYKAKVQECEALIQRNISLRNEMDDLSLKLSSLDSVMNERDSLASKLMTLEDTMAELKVKANRGAHYKQIANEMEERVVEMERELLTTAQKSNSLEKKLQKVEKEVRKEQERNEKLENQIRKLKSEEKESLNPQMTEDIRQSLLTEIEEQQQSINQSKVQIKELEQKLDFEENEKLKLLKELSELEDRFLTVEKNHTSSSVQLRHQLSITKNDLEDCKKYVGQLESERQSLCTKLHVKPDPRIGFEGSRGGGTLGNLVSMSDASNRNGLSAIDTLYLKNVLFKFIEAMAKQKETERDMLIPPLATLLGATREEFAQLRKILSESSKDSRNLLSLWTVR